MDKFRQFAGSLDRENQIEMLKWLQKPGEKLAKGHQLTPEAESFANTFKDWMQAYQKKLEALPQTDQMEFRENYVTQLWRDPKGAMQHINEHGAKQGSGYFTKARVFDDYEEGIRAGFAPVTTDPMELFARYIENASKKIAGWETINEAKDKGLVVYRKLENRPEGWTPIKGMTDAFGHQAYAPPGFADIYNAWTSRLPEGWKGKGLEWASRASNLTTSFKLGISGFHAALETGEAVISGMADGIDKIMSGHPLKGVFEIGKSPTKPFTSFAASRRAVKTYLDGEYGSSEMQKIVNALTDANYDFMRRGGLADEYRTSRLPDFFSSFKRGLIKQEMAKGISDIQAKPVSGSAKFILENALRAYDSTMGLTFQYYVPKLKNQAAVDMMKTSSTRTQTRRPRSWRLTPVRCRTWSTHALAR